MRPSFNTAGPCIPGEHYMLPPERRLGRALELIDDGKYFTLTAGRQTGKTTSAHWLARHLEDSGRFRAMWVDLQVAREQPDPVIAFRAIFQCLDWAIETYLPDVGPPAERARYLESPETSLVSYLRDLSARCGEPLVLLLDESDGLVGRSMVSFLTQLRQGYIARSQVTFPWSIALVGMRAVRDYALAEEDRRSVAWLGTTSPFNITAEALSLSVFTSADVEELLAQHTAATGQRFEPAAIAAIHELSGGHPWLVNALADRIVDRDVRDRTAAVTAAHVESAKESLILERRTHIDSLLARLREPRVRRILDPMIAGTAADPDTFDDDLEYVLALGLLRRTENLRIEIANPIYREIIPRALSAAPQESIAQDTPPFVLPDGSLDISKLMHAWQTFWREDGHLAAEGFQYRESAPHLMLMAFLQRIVNGGGRIQREFGLGRGALDLVIEWRGRRYPIEIKLRRDTQTEERALSQLARYLDTLALSEGWLVMFDLRTTRPWEERLWTRTVDHEGKRIHLVGC